MFASTPLAFISAPESRSYAATWCVTIASSADIRRFINAVNAPSQCASKLLFAAVTP